MPAGLVEARTALVNTVRGMAKSVGERVAECDADNMGVGKIVEFPEGLQQMLKPLMEQWNH